MAAERRRAPARPASETLLSGIPTTSGRHGGCRLLIARNGALLVGTGDAAVGTNPRNLRSLGGKTLRLNRITGAPWPTNPFIAPPTAASATSSPTATATCRASPSARDGTLWSVEHGS